MKNFEAYAKEILENFEEMFIVYTDSEQWVMDHGRYHNSYICANELKNC